MSVNLKGHQHDAYEGVKDAFETTNKTLLVQPTGTGKTYVAFKVLEDDPEAKVVFVTRYKETIRHIKENIEREYGKSYKEVFPNLELVTYSVFTDLQYNKEEGSRRNVKNIDADMLILDEAHHVMAPKWNKNITDYMRSHENMKVLGMTATPERADGIDVRKEFFDENVAYEMSLEQAVADEILEFPDYVTAIYTYKDIIEDLETRIEELEEGPTKEMLQQDMLKARQMLEKADGIDEILGKRIEDKTGKYIVFCKDIDHMKQMMEESKEWFSKVGTNVQMYSVDSNRPKKVNDKTMAHFKGEFTEEEQNDGKQKEHEESLKLLFCVDMINEGVHIQGISGTLMLRPTASHVVYSQQLGRVLSIEQDQSKRVVFDLVNNIDSQKAVRDFLSKVIAIKKERGEPVEDLMERFNIFEEQRELVDILEKIDGTLDSTWEQHYEELKTFMEAHNGGEPKARGGKSVEAKKERNLYNWLHNQKVLLLKKYQDGELQNIPEELREKVKKLKDLGIAYVEKDFKSKEETYEEWKTWVLEHKITPSVVSKDDYEKRLAQRMSGVLKRLKNEPEKYKEELTEYERLYGMFGRRKDDKSKEETFEEWKTWVLEHKTTPSVNSKDDYEKRLNQRMTNILVRMKNEPEKYKEKLTEYERLYGMFGRRKDDKSKEETFEEWKAWALEHKITPSRISKDDYEKKLAQRMKYALKRMESEPEKYKEEFIEYERLYGMYGRSKDNKTKEETYEEWKKWVLEHKVTPSEYSKDDYEKKLAQRMSAILKRLKSESKKYKEELIEYKRLYGMYGRSKDNKTKEETYKEWKTWVLEHKITPSQNSEDAVEKRLAQRMGSALKRLKNEPGEDKYKKELAEYERLYSEYGRIKRKCNIESKKDEKQKN